MCVTGTLLGRGRNDLEKMRHGLRNPSSSLKNGTQKGTTAAEINQYQWWGGRERVQHWDKLIISRDIFMPDRTGLLDEHAHEPVQARWEGGECDKGTHTCQRTRNCISPPVPTVMSRKPGKQVYTLWEHNFVCAPMISEDRKKQIPKMLQILTHFLGLRHDNRQSIQP